MTRKQIEKATWEWRDYLGLNNWDICIAWKKKKSKNATDEFPAVAYTEINHQYKLATIYYSPNLRKDIGPNVIVHELLHCVISPLVSLASLRDAYQGDYFNEQITSELERIIMRLRNRIKD